MTTVEACRFQLERPDLLRAHACARNFDAHMHDTFSIVILTRGRVALRSPRWQDTVHEGDVFLFNPFEVHAGGDPGHIAEYDVLYPSIRFVQDCIPRPKRGPAPPLLRTAVQRRSETNEALLESLRATKGASGAVETALQRLLQGWAPDPASIPENGLSAVEVACRVIRETYMHPISTEGLARHAGLHKCHFIRIFHRITGLAPQTYVRQVRLARARELICAGAELADAAQSAGFCDQAHLTREFKKVHGVTPGQLSRDLRKSCSIAAPPRPL